MSDTVSPGDFTPFVAGPGDPNNLATLTDVSLNNAFSTKVDKSQVGVTIARMENGSVIGEISGTSLVSTPGGVPRTLGARFSDSINVKDHGAKGDGVELAAPVVTVSSASPNAFTIAGGAFTGADVGKSIFIANVGPTIVAGSGGAGSGLFTTISAVTSGTTITTAAPAQNFVTAAAIPYLVYFTDDRVAINAAISAASAIKGEVFYPSGIYGFDSSKGTVNVPSNVMHRGAGRGKAIILVCDANGSTDGITNSTGGTNFPATTNVAFFDLTVRGLRQGIVSAGADIFRVGNCTNLTVAHCAFEHSRAMGLGAPNCFNVLIDDCNVYHTNADGIYCWNSDEVKVTNCHIRGANDDAISLHSVLGSLAPVRSSLVVTGNTITESSGISALGAKNLTVSGNVLRRIMTHGINVECAGPNTQQAQGLTAPFNIKITDNQISDVFFRQEPNPRNGRCDYIRIVSMPRQAATGSSAAPGDPVSGGAAANIMPLYGAAPGGGNFYANGIFPGNGVASPGGYWFDISGNTLTRTLPACATWDQYGFGSSLFVGDNGDPTTGLYDGAMSDTAFQPTAGIDICGTMRNSRISRNIIQTSGKYGIYFVAGVQAAWQNGDLDNLDISDNKIIDFSQFGIFFSLGGTVQRVLCDRNLIDGDPYFKSTNRSAAIPGAWTVQSGASGIPAATTINASGITWRDNAFRNVTHAILEGLVPGLIERNLLYCRPAAVGASASNLGIGYVQNDCVSYMAIIEDCDPTSATYGQLLQDTVVEASTVPTAGLYVAGRTVKNTAYTIGAPTEWLRLTTGSAHVLGVDWQAIYPGRLIPGTPTLSSGTLTSGSNNTRGQINIPAGTLSVAVSFSVPMPSTPFMLSNSNVPTINSSTNTVSVNGFTVTLSSNDSGCAVSYVAEL